MSDQRAVTDRDGVDPTVESSGVSRRTFIRIVSVAGAGLTLGVTYKVVMGSVDEPATDAAFAPDAWLRIDEDGAVTIMVNKSEMGQGITTALPQLLAEELEVPLERVDFAFAPAHPAYRMPPMGMQLTAGSTSVMTSWEPLRRAGATARWMLREAAAQMWGVAPDQVSMADGSAIHPDGSSLSYGELAVTAATIAVPTSVPLKDPSEFRLIGTSPPRLDIPLKTTGQAVFGMDAGPSDARVAVIARSPIFGGVLRSFDPAPALAVEGVDEVVEVAAGVAVVANGYWVAKKGRDALRIEWDEGEGSVLDDAEISRRFQAAVESGGKAARDDGDVDVAMVDAGTVVSSTYSLPYLAHTTMEPMNCTAVVQDGHCTVWAPTQFQDAPGIIGGGSRQAAAKAAGLDEDKVELHTTFLGGGFGRRAERDFVIEAAELASKVAGPVRVIWPREDDVQHDYYRPASYHELSAALDEAGRPIAWRHEMALQSIMENWIPGWLPKFVASWAGFTPGGVDPTAVEGAENHPYLIPNVRVSWADVPLPIPIGFWRSVGNSHNGFVVESFVDELAHSAGQDPYQYRRAMLMDQPRHQAVLDAVAEISGWDTAPPEGRARGIAVVSSFGSYVAEVAEVSVEAGRLRIHKIWCATDCGVVVNPGIVRAQMESAIVYGLTAALYGRISIEGGRAVQSNFHDYPMLRMNEAPEVEVVLVPSGDPPGGVGEPGLPPAAPAVTNALFALTGQRIRDLPIRLG
ncbi:MAG: xanthine dehydrogenase family protein molybdopterin-binding subunit [Gemmatimonadota bacterium]|nr:MAG: xanthine dehydrogenase family protein molybdopterin-binding subunit [Gemmatimonadota bacterium]